MACGKPGKNKAQIDLRRHHVAELTAVFAASSSSDGRRSLGLSESSVELLGDGVDVVADIESLGCHNAAVPHEMDEEAVQRTEHPLAR